MRVVDGDTVVLNVALDFNVWLMALRFRLARINCPELPTPEGKAAREFLISLLAGQSLTVSSKRQDAYGRWLCELWAGWPTDGTRLNVNDKMVESGHATYVLKEQEP